MPRIKPELPSVFLQVKSALLLILATVVFPGTVPICTAADPPQKIEFNRDVRPILADRCFTCHGPDSAKRQADLRLDRSDAATSRRGDSRAIVPGDSAASDAYRRMISTDPDLQMPPPDSNLKLSAAEIAVLKAWIDGGAEYQPHWSFLSPVKVVPPATRHAAGETAPIDSFIREKLEREGLTPAPEADRATLYRRAAFDLTGLPPTPDEIDEFLADQSPDAYERLIDRLLASPRYGERMAVNWLDAARFADTNGYQTDGPRFMWRWRDWVIDAFNQNQPFDEFTIDQLAGDLLNESDSDSPIADSRLIATGFNRNHRGNAEGGIIPEEFRVEYVVDRVETTATVWLGLTIGCARCHDHKYDPISQREFYQLFAFFNQVPEPGKYIRNDNSMPYLPAPTPSQQRRLEELQAERRVAEAAWTAIAPAIEKGMSDLVANATVTADWDVAEKLDFRISFDSADPVIVRSESISPPAKTITYQWKGETTGASLATGRTGQAARFDGNSWIDAGDSGDFADDESFVVSCWIKPATDNAMTILSKMDHDNSSKGYELRREATGRVQALFSGRILDDLIRVETKTPLPVNQWSHVLLSYDGSSAARGVAIRINGEPAELAVITDLLSNPIRSKLPLCIGAGGSAAPFEGMIDDVRAYRGRLTPEAQISLAAGATIDEIIRHAKAGKLSVAEQEKLREFYLANHATAKERQARQAFRDSQDRYTAYLATVPTTMVMQDQMQRSTFLLKRGEYDKPGEQVSAGLPAVFPAPARLTGRARQDRLALAQWLVAAENPLTARVTVNRYWQSLFGVGLVKTAEDFGIQGEAPSHPELLDWLAREFSDPGRSAWDVKRTWRQLVTSATYRQSSATTADVAAHDPDNRWLARGPRFRLAAEMIRDATLAASGLLVESLGGPSVKPYQPAGLWEELSAEAVPGPFATYTQDHGPNLYRRGIYTFRKRTVPPPSLAIFDASPREACRVSLARTNTPLQALNLMNDVTYVEAARVLAQQAMREGGASAASRLNWIFRQALSRQPGDRELQVLVEGFERRRAAYERHPDAARLLIKSGETPVDEGLPVPELAAYTATASVILNLDEFVAKP